MTREVVADVLDRPLCRGRTDHRAESGRDSSRAAWKCRRSIAARRWCRPGRASSTTPTAPRPVCGSRSVSRPCCCCRARRASSRPMLASVVDEMLAPRCVGRLARQARRQDYRPHRIAHGRSGAAALSANGRRHQCRSRRRFSRRSDRSSCTSPRGRHRAIAPPRPWTPRARQVAGVLGLDAYSLEGRTLEQVVGELLVERGLAYRLRRVVHGRPADVASDGRRRQLTVRRARGRRVRERRQDRAARRAAGAHRRTRRRERAGRAGDGGGYSRERRVDVGVGVTGIAGPGGGAPRSRSAPSPWRRWSRVVTLARVPVRRRSGAGQVSGVAGRAGHGPADAARRRGRRPRP